MAVTSPLVLYSGATGYDLRSLLAWWTPVPQENPAVVYARFRGSPDQQVKFTATTFTNAVSVIPAAYLFTVGGTTFDLRKVVAWWDNPTATVPASVLVRMDSTGSDSVIACTKSTFEAAMQACQDLGGY
jgi:hypothetical protein